MFAEETIMPAPRKYPDELRDRAVRLAREDGQHSAIARFADRLDINRETLRNWVKGERRRREEPEVVDLKAENSRLRRQVAELERDKQILKAASVSSRGNSTVRSDDDPLHRRPRRAIRRHSDLTCSGVSTYYAHRRRPPSERALWDDHLAVEVRRLS
jgi:transposase